MTRYVVLGAGAIGGTVGGLLAEQGSEVTLVARGEHAERLRADGLRLERPDRLLQQTLPVETDPARLSLQPGDVLLLTVKGQHTDQILSRVAAADGSDQVTVVCLQNGVANEDLALRRFDRVVGACVLLPATALEPGVVVAEGWPLPGRFVLGRHPAGSSAYPSADEVLAGIDRDLSAAGFAVQTVDDVMPWKRAKLLRNVANAVDALTGAGHSHPASRAIGRAARAEAERVFAAAGLAVVPPEEWEAARGESVGIAAVGGRERGGSSSWQSLVRGGDLETDWLNGEISLLGRHHSIATPVNAGLQQTAAVAVARGAQPGAVTPEELARRLDVDLPEDGGEGSA